MLHWKKKKKKKKNLLLRKVVIKTVAQLSRETFIALTSFYFIFWHVSENLYISMICNDNIDIH
jgi:hypothetical protein